MKTVQNNCFSLANTSHRSGCYVSKLTKFKDSIAKNESFDLIHDNFQTSAPKNTNMGSIYSIIEQKMADTLQLILIS